jgi:hypothetical protein
LLEGTPALRAYDFLEREDRLYGSGVGLGIEIGDTKEAVRRMACVLSMYHGYPQTEHRFYSNTGGVGPGDFAAGSMFDDVPAAVNAARSARFEHGETPSTSSSTSIAKGSAFSFPTGIHKARFEGVSDMPGSPCLGKEGRMMPSACRWRFRIFTGRYVNKTLDRITGKIPTDKNACGRMVDGLAGRQLPIGETFDPHTKVGQTYYVTVGRSRNNPERTQIVDVFPRV